MFLDFKLDAEYQLESTQRQIIWGVVFPLYFLFQVDREGLAA